MLYLIRCKRLAMNEIEPFLFFDYKIGAMEGFVEGVVGLIS